MSQPFWSYATIAAQASTDAYADLEYGDPRTGEKWNIIDAFTSGPLSVQLRNEHAANGITYRILGSNDKTLADDLWVVVTAEAALAAEAEIALTHSLSYYLFYKVQIKATSAGNQGSVASNAVHKRV